MPGLSDSPSPAPYPFLIVLVIEIIIVIIFIHIFILVVFRRGDSPVIFPFFSDYRRGVVVEWVAFFQLANYVFEESLKIIVLQDFKILSITNCEGDLTGLRQWDDNSVSWFLLRMGGAGQDEEYKCR